MNVALKIKVLESGKRQIQIAREIGISEPQLSKIVMGWVEPCEELKRRIAKALGCVGMEEIFSVKRQREHGKGKLMSKGLLRCPCLFTRNSKKENETLPQVEGPSGKGKGEGPGLLPLPPLPTGRGNGHKYGRMAGKQNQNPTRHI